MPLDLIIHCGDGVGDLFQIDLPAGVKVVRVLGNVDLSRDLHFDRVEMGTVDSLIFLVLHGDQVGVKSGYSKIRSEAEKYSVNTVFFGHTHNQYFEEKNSLVLFNPGSVSQGFYGICEVGDKVDFSLYRLDD